jgi:hypothetical protein
MPVNLATTPWRVPETTALATIRASEGRDPDGDLELWNRGARLKVTRHGIPCESEPSPHRVTSGTHRHPTRCSSSRCGLSLAAGPG